MNQNRARDNELQRAIDEITRKAAPAPGAGTPMAEPKPTNAAVSPVMPVTSAAPASAAMPAQPVTPVVGPKPPVPPMPPMGGTKPVDPVKPEAKVGDSLPPVKPVSAPVPPSVSSIVAGAQPAKKPAESVKPQNERRGDRRDQDNRPEMKRPLGQNNADMQSIKEAALKELLPIMNRVELKPEKQFELYRDMLEVMKDKEILKPAHEAAKEIKDEKARADALIYLIETIEKMD